MEKALLSQPQEGRAIYARAGQLISEGRLVDAMRWYRRARMSVPLAEFPWARESWLNWRLNRKTEAIRAARRSILLAPGFGSALSNLGIAHKRWGTDMEAGRHFSRALCCEPSSQAIGMNQAVLQLRDGNFERGWTFYRNRYIKLGAIPSTIWPELPEWTGEPLAGRLRIISEQGIGDAIMFLTLMSEVLKRAPCVTLLVAPRLKKLMQRSFPSVEVVAPADGELPPLPPAERWICSGDLPGALGLFIDRDIQPSPFLKPDLEQQDRLRAHLKVRAGGRKLVGVTWTSKAEDGWQREIAPETWQALRAREDLALVSLQYDLTDTDVAKFSGDLIWDHGVEPRRDLDGFASLIAALDCVVSPVNNTMHFAGAPDVPCHTLIPIDPDWRWGQEGKESRWYKRMRLYRQSSVQGWPQVIDQVNSTL